MYIAGLAVASQPAPFMILMSFGICWSFVVSTSSTLIIYYFWSMGVGRQTRRCCVVFCGVGMVVAVFFTIFSIFVQTDTDGGKRSTNSHTGSLQIQISMSSLFTQFRVTMSEEERRGGIFFFFYLLIYIYWGWGVGDGGGGRGVYMLLRGGQRKEGELSTCFLRLVYTLSKLIVGGGRYLWFIFFFLSAFILLQLVRM